MSFSSSASAATCSQAASLALESATAGSSVSDAAERAPALARRPPPGAPPSSACREKGERERGAGSGCVCWSAREQMPHHVCARRARRGKSVASTNMRADICGELFKRGRLGDRAVVAGGVGRGGAGCMSEEGGYIHAWTEKAARAIIRRLAASRWRARPASASEAARRDDPPAVRFVVCGLWRARREGGRPIPNRGAREKPPKAPSIAFVSVRISLSNPECDASGAFGEMSIGSSSRYTIQRIPKKP